MMRDRSEPTRLRDGHDQVDPVERIAGQAARDVPEPLPLSALELARIAAGMDPRRSRLLRVPLRTWALAMGAFLLGIATAASAAHLDLVPRWMTRIMQDSTEPTPVKPSKPQPSMRKREALPALPGTAGDQITRAQPPAPSPVVVPETSVAPARSAPSMPGLPGDRQRSPRLLARRSDPSTAPGTETPAAARPFIAWTGDAPTTGPAGAPTPAASGPALPAGAGLGQAPAAAAAGRGLPSSPALAPAAAGPPQAGATWGSAAGTPPSKAAVQPAPPPQTAALLTEIVHALRIERAPGRALALLDQHAGELAGQAFSEESLLLRVEAMLALGQRAAVLRLLDRTSLTELSVSSSLLTTRGELRSADHRCAEGIGDFDLVLAGSRRPPKQALLGRARCKEQLGDQAGAQADLDRYRRAYPAEPSP